MLVKYIHELTKIPAPKNDFEDLSDMQVKITQKMYQFIYLSNNGGKYFINPIFSQIDEKRQKKSHPGKDGFRL